MTGNIDPHFDIADETVREHDPNHESDGEYAYMYHTENHRMWLDIAY